MVPKRMMLLALPYPPSINHYYGRSKIGIFIKRKGKEYRKRVAIEIKSKYVGWRPLKGRLSVSYEAKMPDKRIRDIDNLLKCLNDSLEKGGAFENDNQIDELTIIRGPVFKGGKVTVCIKEMEESDE